MIANELYGLRFGSLEVIGRSEQKHGMWNWACRCICGRVVSVNGTVLKAGRKSSCGCLTVRATRKDKRRVEKSCCACGASFEVVQSGVDRKFCSRECWRTYSKDTLRDIVMRNVPQLTESECWIWRGTIGAGGYGWVTSKQHGVGKAYAHRLVYQLTKGEIPDGMVVRHDCDNPSCVNPHHLRVGTQADNMRDAAMRCRASNSKLTAADVGYLRDLHSVMGMRRVDLAALFGVTVTHVGRVINGQSWRSVAA